MKELLNFTGTKQRADYCLQYLGLIVATIAVAFVGIMLLATESTAGIIFGTVVLLSIIPIVIYNWKISTQRTRDTGLNPWFVLIALVPYVSFAFLIFLLLAPTNAMKK